MTITALMLAGSAQAQQRPIIGATVTRVVAGELGSGRLVEIVARVASISPADTAEVRLHVGDTLSLSSTLLIAYDSTGVEIGRFRTFDSAVKTNGSLTSVGPRRYVAAAEGPVEFELKFPRAIWGTRTDAPASTGLRVTVVP
ncbi:MAG: hypothetical protein ABI120_19935 [Gemmatimonadaceae bacterium]